MKGSSFTQNQCEFKLLAEMYTNVARLIGRVKKEKRKSGMRQINIMDGQNCTT